MDILIFIVIILLASILQTSTGFGFSILATPFLLLIFTPIEAVQINIILSLFISFSLYTKIRKDIDMNMLKKFLIGSLIGLPFGLIIFLILDITTLKLVIGLIILIFTIMLFCHFRIKASQGKHILIGSISGALTTSMGMAGPPLLLYFSSIETDKEKLRGTAMAYYLFVYVLSLVVQIIFIGTDSKTWIWSGFAIPLVLIGMYIGQILFKRINQHIFRMITYVILLFTATYLLIEVIL